MNSLLLILTFYLGQLNDFQPRIYIYIFFLTEKRNSIILIYMFQKNITLLDFHDVVEMFGSGF